MLGHISWGFMRFLLLRFSLEGRRDKEGADLWFLGFLKRGKRWREVLNMALTEASAKKGALDRVSFTRDEERPRK